MTTIQSRDYKLTDANKNKVEDSVKKLVQSYENVHVSAVFISKDGSSHKVVLTGAADHLDITASAEHDHLYGALSAALAKFERQIRKRKTKIHRKDREVK